MLEIIFSKLFSWLSTVKFKLNLQSGVWIGLSDPQVTLQWQWSDKTNYNWSYWNPGIEPSDNVNENCTTAVGLGDKYFWQREDCTVNAAVICQQRLTPPLVSSMSAHY